MKRKNRLALLLTCLMVIALFAGCSSDPSATQGNPAPAESTTPSENTDTPIENNSDVTVDSPVVESNTSVDGFDLGGLVLPLAEEMTTLTAFRNFSNQVLSDPQEIACYPIIEERTNIHIDWETYTAAEQFPLYIAAQEYADMIFSSITEYTGGIDKAIEDEVYVNGRPYLSLMPNFSAYLTNNADVLRQCSTDSGNIYFNNIQDEGYAWTGPAVRSDWLADCNLEIPVTYDDWYHMLVAFRDQCNADGALFLSPTGYSTTGFGLTVGFNTVATFYAENGTTAKYGILDEGMREYISMMAQWYQEGLIDRDFMSHTGAAMYTDLQALYTNGTIGAFDDLNYVFKSFLPVLNADEDDDIISTPYPSKTADEQGSLHFRRVDGACGTTPIYITTAAETRGVAELCAKWIDYRYSEDGAILLNYGPKGVSWEMGENGPYLTDFFLYNEEYSVSQMKGMYTDSGYGALYLAAEVENLMYAPEIQSMRATWNESSTGDWCMPPVTLTAEESEEYSSMFNDISTHVDESLLRFIVGDKSMDEWDTFLAELETMGIDTCIELQQAALDRYINR